MALCCCHHGALACTPLGETFQHKQGCRTTNSEDGFQAFQRPQTLYLVWGEGGSKNYQEIMRGGSTNSAFTNGGALHNNFPFEAHFSAPFLIIITQSLRHEKGEIYACCLGKVYRLLDLGFCDFPGKMDKAFYLRPVEESFRV